MSLPIKFARFEFAAETAGLFIALPWTRGRRWEAFVDRTGHNLSTTSVAAVEAGSA